MSSPEAAAVALVPPVSNVGVLCGTHGNEMSGIFLHRFWSTHVGRREIERNAIRVETTLTNELAVARCVRYVDVDLNRSFKEENYRSIDADGKGDDESSSKKAPYEANRVAELMALLGGGKTDIAFDLHNTTANAGVMLMIKYVCQSVLWQIWLIHPLCLVLRWPILNAFTVLPSYCLVSH